MKSAFITGGADGIGAGIARRLSDLGYAVTLADINLPLAESVAASLPAPAQALRCDVTSESSQAAALASHVACFGGLDVAVLNAGIMETGALLDTSTDSWRRCLDVNLLGVLYGVRLAAQHMRRGGAILAVASAGGVYPMPLGPVYATAKSGVVMLVRSLSASIFKEKGIRLSALCPEYVDTALVRGVREQRGGAVADALLRPVNGRLLTVDRVAEVAVGILQDANSAGQVAMVMSSGEVMTPSIPRLKKLQGSGLSGGGAKSVVSMDPGPIPKTARKVVVTTLSPDFRKATRIERFPLPTTAVALPPGTVLIRYLYCGINASDVNFTSGKYQTGGGPSQPPFDAGFEACGVVAAAAADVAGLTVGQPVATMQYGGFSEYTVLPAKVCIAVPRASPAVVALLTSGLTASISLERTARLRPGETVLITAAAGGTGQFYVQLAKAAGATVVAVAGGPEKVKLLRELGADRVIDYKAENLKQVLKKEYPKGVDVVCELVGGEMFNTCFSALKAGTGRLMVIGMVSQYASGWKPLTYTGLPEKLLARNTALLGFFLPMHAGHFRRHLAALLGALEAGKLRVALDPRRFVGLDAVFDAVDHLQSGRSVGKVVLALEPPATQAKL